VGGGFHPNDEQRSIVQLGAAYRIPEDEIVLAVLNPATKKPISPVTLRKHFAEELKMGFMNGRMRIMAATFQSAQGIKDADGKFAVQPNVTAQIWLGKTLYGMRERVEVDVPLTPAASAAMGTPEGEEITLEAARRVAFTLRLGATIADRKPVTAKAKKA
jgi:hypothetical protein